MIIIFLILPVNKVQIILIFTLLAQLGSLPKT